MSTTNTSDKGSKGNRRLNNIRKPFFSIHQAQAQSQLQTPQGQQNSERNNQEMDTDITSEQMQEIRETVSLFCFLNAINIRVNNEFFLLTNAFLYLV